MVIFNKLLAFLMLALLIPAVSLAAKRKIVLITDLEPDDRFAIHLLASQIEPEELLLVGTTVMNTAQKRLLTQILLQQLGFGNVPVVQGTGGFSDEYPSFQATKPARHYPREGLNILNPQALEMMWTSPRKSMDLQNKIETVLSESDGVEFLVLAPPTDLAAVLKRRPDLHSKVGHIWIMGGWSESVDEKGQTILRTTYNWNMEFLKGDANTRTLMTMEEIPMTVFSFHSNKKAIPTRSMSPQNFPAFWNAVKSLKSLMPSLQQSVTALKSWNQFVLESLSPSLPHDHPLKVALTLYGDSQISPADPLTTAGMFDSDIIESSRRVSIRLDYDDVDLQKGIRVYVTNNPTSNIRVVEQINVSRFAHMMTLSLHSLRKNLSESL